MKKISFALVIILSVTGSVFAQTKEPVPVDPAESAAIEKTATDYAGGFFTGDSARVASAVHPELAKRIITKDDKGNAMIQNMGASGLVYAAMKSKKNDPNPSEPFKATVTIYDVFNGIATVKIVTNKFDFIDYAQLAKIKGHWKIINVLWAFTH